MINDCKMVGDIPSLSPKPSIVMASLCMLQAGVIVILISGLQVDIIDVPQRQWLFVDIVVIRHASAYFRQALLSSMCQTSVSECMQGWDRGMNMMEGLVVNGGMWREPCWWWRCWPRTGMGVRTRTPCRGSWRRGGQQAGNTKEGEDSGKGGRGRRHHWQYLGRDGHQVVIVNGLESACHRHKVQADQASCVVVICAGDCGRCASAGCRWVLLSIVSWGWL